MSKFIFLTLTLFISVNSISQDKDLPELDFDDYDFPKSIVVNVDGKSQLQLEAQVQNWVDDYYSETSLLDCEFTEHNFSITARENRLLKIKNLSSDLIYELRIYLRDNKYKLEITSLKYKYYTEFRPIENVNLIKDDIIKSDLLDSRSTLSSFFKDLNYNLFNSIRNEQDQW